MFGGEGGLPAQDFAVDGDRAAVSVAPVDVLAVDVKPGSGGDADALGEADVEFDFGGDFGRAEVGAKFVEVAFAARYFGKIFFKQRGALVGSGGTPFVLVGEEVVDVFLPVALEAGGFGGRGGGGTVLVVGHDVVAVDDGEFAIGGLECGVDARVERGAAGALGVGVFVDDDYGGVEVALDVVADVTVVLVGADVAKKVVIAIIGSLAIAIDDEISGDGKDGDDCDNCDDAADAKSFKMFHKTPL